MEILLTKIEKAFATPKISEISDEVLLDFLTEQISSAYICFGYQRYDSKDISIMAVRLLEEIRDSFSFLHIG